MSLSQLIQAVEEADSSNRLLEAVQNLANARLEGAIPTLIEALSYNNPGAAVAAVDGLILLGDPAVPALLELLDMHNYTARSWAIRALAGIGDPRGLATLLGVATADFAFSVRRAAVKGLGLMKWHWFPDELREIAQEEALEALLFVAHQDDEWVVRYAAVVGLQALAITIADNYPHWLSEIQSQLEQMANKESTLAVRARVWLALKNIQQNTTPEAHTSIQLEQSEAQKSPLTPDDWQDILKKLYEIKRQERAENLEEGDPRRFQKLAASLGKDQP
ncbi:MAG: HEAT repeat domain-containing protein [Pseudanabaena sp.]|jgi:phycocyanobilin lyase beta subunit|nr:HEAT repeat domain-containing protein [Pseudanabaena sp. M53BS1SP1A06MG]MCA6583528.1 HEAT repeat domain-containing protein [Pseudanabaena sp. M34BS1SP1A06MG]MCA6585334.1 HEAT repeat domain-containing protein [Pseudanabaena sp. M051S1SP1A06QC]MCA6591450.1 HEAT repeat domain-containing protein [Pseudanabaena sp. M38BS1SP1A06MG]MCA6595023.1 HEAT repeat domain-containing protein [Pseudanabaena sp. M046S1SP1A06QC]MCA6599270.1 HEAT repeat domain-containing protein [Pseudanabaena sp. M57BS1SP1A06M